MPDSSPSVLLIRLDAVGDALALAPLVAALCAKGIPVSAVLTQRNLDAFAPPTFRERFVAPFRLRDGSRRNRAVIDAFGAELQTRGYTHALVATEDPGGYWSARASGAPMRIGFANGWGKPLKTLWVRSMLTRTLFRTAGLDARAPHECETLFRLGFPLLGSDAVPTRDVALLRPLIVADDPAPDDRVAFQVTDKWERLGIALDGVASCAREIGRVRAIASASEAAYADRFERAAGVRVERFDDIAPWKASIAAASAIVAPDSGALHVAGMVGTPTVAVFAPGRDARLQAARWHPWAAPYRVVTADPKWPPRAVEALAELAAVLRTEHSANRR